MQGTGDTVEKERLSKQADHWLLTTLQQQYCLLRLPYKAVEWYSLNSLRAAVL